MRTRDKERERRERDLEKKAREQADQVALEEQKASLSRELSTLRLTHTKLGHSYRELLEKKKDSERDSPLFVSEIISSTPEKGGERKEKVEEEEEEAYEEDSVEFDLRNTDSVFSELSELSRDYVESVDRGASIRSADQFEEILSQYEELKVTELIEAARKALISRVVELTDDRSAQKLEVTSLQETVSRLEARMREKEDETKLRKELEACQSENPDASLPASMRHFSRSEMARVVMEKNQYKQRLFELQEAVRHSQTSPRARRRELYREIRSQVWGTLGKRQIHGWSLPLANTQEPVPEPKDVPVLMQLRLLDQRDSTAKFSQNQVVAGLADGTLAFFSHGSCSVWVVSGPASCSDITVIDPARSNTVLDQFSLPPTAPALCLCAVPPVLQPVRCCLAKGGRLWVGYWNRQTFSVSERSEQQVRFLCAAGSGVWTSCRLDPVLRLFDWSTGRPLQEVDFAAVVTRTLLQLSPLQISSLTVVSGRLWVGTGGGAVFSIPLSISEDVSIPYCSTASAQLCYHGHRQAVRFIIAAPCLITSPGSSHITTSQLVLSGGEGYVNFRIDDAGDDEPAEASQSAPQRSERSHMIIWQNPSVPSPAL
uniref:Si:dkey-17m8.1 n=1 Tax=Stegastes partitus TaxID=144197 RepID=A0A3B5B595_9TELE